MTNSIVITWGKRIVLALTIVIALILLIFNIPFLQKPVAAFIIKRALASENISCKLESSSFTFQKLTATGVELNIYNEIVKIPNFEADINWETLLQKKAASYHAVIPEIIVGDNFLKLKADLSGRINILSSSFLASGNIEAYSGAWLKQNQLSHLKLFSDIKFTDDKTIINNLEFNISDKGNINLSGIVGYQNNPFQLTELELKGNIKTLPLRLYEVIAPAGHPVRSFFDEYILAGEISSGNWQINLPNEFFKDFHCDKTKIGFRKCEEPKFNEEYISANLAVKDFAYKYNPSLPAIEKVTTNITLQGSKVLINLTSADVGGTRVKNGLVDLDWLKPNMVVNAKAEAEGEVASLLKFISPEATAKMKTSNIDLSSLKGKAFTKVNLSIPVTENIPNKYDITTSVPYLTGKLFGERVNLQKMHLHGKFDGDKVELDADGNINNFKSNVKVIVNLDKENPISHHVKAKIWLAGSNEDGKDHIVITHGKVPLDLEYIGKKEASTLKANADLTKLGFNINSISLTKPLGRKAKLSIDGEVIEGKKQFLNLKLTGEDNLKILGAIDIEDHISKLKLSEVRYSNNNFQAEITIGEKRLKAKITGGLLDLSESDFATFFEKNDKKNIDSIKLTAHLDEVRLKNNTKLRQVLFALDCHENHCQRAEFNSFINSEIFRATMSNSPNYDLWVVETSDAGALVNGLNLTNKINGGRFTFSCKVPNLSLSSSNRAIEGNFRLANFSTKKNKFLARIVSFISVPGLLNSLTTSTIPFELLRGDFALKEGIILFPEIEADGAYFSFNARGTVDTNVKKVDLKGRVIPSLYGLNKLVGSFPLIGALFGKGRGILFAPFYIKENY